MNLKNPQYCPFQHCCQNFVRAKNGNCAVEMDDILDCWVETEKSQQKES